MATCGVAPLVTAWKRQHDRDGRQVHGGDWGRNCLQRAMRDVSGVITLLYFLMALLRLCLSKLVELGTKKSEFHCVLLYLNRSDLKKKLVRAKETIMAFFQLENVRKGLVAPPAPLHAESFR